MMETSEHAKKSRAVVMIVTRLVSLFFLAIGCAFLYFAGVKFEYVMAIKFLMVSLFCAIWALRQVEVL